MSLYMIGDTLTITEYGPNAPRYPRNKKLVGNFVKGTYKSVTKFYPVLPVNAVERHYYETNVTYKRRATQRIYKRTTYFK